MNKKPDITQTRTIAKGRLFSLETVSLSFANGQQHDYERIVAPAPGAAPAVA